MLLPGFNLKFLYIFDRIALLYQTGNDRISEYSFGFYREKKNYEFNVVSPCYFFFFSKEGGKRGEGINTLSLDKI